jgi:hypothetical protein
MKYVKLFENYNDIDKAQISIDVKVDGKVLPHLNIPTIYDKSNIDINEIGNFIKSLTPNADRIRITKSVYNSISDTWMEMDNYEHHSNN